MDFRLTPKEEAFKEKFTAWLKENLPEDWASIRHRRDQSPDELKQVYKAFQKRLFGAGYAGMHFPTSVGGQGGTLMEEAIILQTLATTCLELRFPGIITHAMATPTLFTCGSAHQKTEFIPDILNGNHLWCQGFSEPDAGSDVANVATQAIRDGDHYVVNGQKVWTSYAHIADYCLLLVRTDPDTVKHKGLSYLLVDMTLPGIDVRPMTQMTGEAEFNEIFFDNVHVPVSMRVGNEGQGWQIAITTLMFERVLGDVVIGSAYEKSMKDMIEMAARVKRSGKPVIEDPVFRQDLARSVIEVMVLKTHGLRSFSRQLNGEIPGADGSIGKLLWSEPNQRLTETAIHLQGLMGQVTSGSPWAIDHGYWPYAFLRAKGNTIEAGTSEIQRNIIGERVLGLPKDIARAGK